MKVLEHGNAYHIIACPKCLCTIEYLDKDVGYVYRPNPVSWNVLNAYKVIVCPECCEQIDV